MRDIVGGICCFSHWSEIRRFPFSELGRFLSVPQLRFDADTDFGGGCASQEDSSHRASEEASSSSVADRGAFLK